MSASRCCWPGWRAPSPGAGSRVRPFKPQNMSNNAAVTADGGEIGRAQALAGARLRRRPGHRHEPGAAEAAIGGRGADRARTAGSGAARRRGEYRRLAPSLLPAVLGAFARLAEAADLVLVEGAGSPAEINLRAGDIANMGFAEAADVPVVLIGDIERGGVIAQLVGTHALLSASERALLAGYIVNKFRGDVGLFDGGIAAIGERTGLRVLRRRAVLSPPPQLLPAEDSLALAPISRTHLAHGGTGCRAQRGG